MYLDLIIFVALLFSLAITMTPAPVAATIAVQPASPAFVPFPVFAPRTKIFYQAASGVMLTAKVVGVAANGYKLNRRGHEFVRPASAITARKQEA